MSVEDVTLRDIDDSTSAIPFTIDKVLRLRVPQDSQGRLEGDKLFLEVLINYENFETQTLTKIGETITWTEKCKCEKPGCEMLHPVKPSTEQKCIGSFTLELDDVIAALQLLKNNGL